MHREDRILDSDNLAPIINSSLLEQTKEIAQAIRRKEIVALVGAGLSIPRGFPSWRLLINRLILAWREWDRTEANKLLSPTDYVAWIRQSFEEDLAVASYIRRSIDAENERRAKERESGNASSEDAADISFGQLLYSAQY